VEARVSGRVEVLATVALLSLGRDVSFEDG
jgi:hypothetical protein